MKTIQDMAQETGLIGKPIYKDGLEAFAALVREDEREACANVCEQHGYDHYCGNVTDKIAETIRSRSNT